jgi:hypothetical protein
MTKMWHNVTSFYGILNIKPDLRIYFIIIFLVVADVQVKVIPNIC